MIVGSSFAKLELELLAVSQVVGTAIEKALQLKPLLPFALFAVPPFLLCFVVGFFFPKQLLLSLALIAIALSFLARGWRCIEPRGRWASKYAVHLFK